MREDKENSIENNRARVSRFTNQNANPNSNSSKLRSAFAKGFSAADKKTKVLPSKKKPLASSDNANGVTTSSQPPRVKRSLIGDLACSMTATQVHPQGYHKRQSSRDLFNELDHLRGLLQESKDREFKLQAELSECKRNSNPRVLVLEREVDELVRKVGLLEGEKVSLAQQLASERNEDGLGRDERECSRGGSVEMEVLELRRLNKEFQMQKRSLACKLASVEAQLASLTKSSESEIIAKIKAEASQLRITNEDLSKQVEGLQMNRLNEVEELAYLRWVNSCLRNELRSSCSITNSDKASSPNSVGSCGDSAGPLSCQSKESLEYSSAKRINLIKKLKKWPLTKEDLSNLDCQEDDHSEDTWIHQDNGRSPRRRHSISGSKYLHEDFVQTSRRQSDGFMCSKETEERAEPLSPAIDLIHTPHIFGHFSEHKLAASVEVEKRALRIPNPPPRPSCFASNELKEASSTQIALPPPPPPPPPPPLKLSTKGSAGVVQRAPQVVEFYHALMKRESRKDTCSGGVCDAPDVSNVRSSMIGEIENRSSHLLAIKADVEIQGEFVNFLIREVNNAAYQNIEDVVAFVKWLDDELCYLVDERAVLKHFDWPESKADTLREAAFGYRDIKKLESEVTSYRDDPRLPCDIALKKMAALSEKMERTVYNLQRTRDSLMHSCREFRIPTDWMLDNGIISKIKLGAVKLAKKYIKRVATELQSKAGQDKDPALHYMLLQGVRFAFRVHQFAGGFDAETMHAFEELRNLGHVLSKT